MTRDGPRSLCAVRQLLSAPTPPRGAGVRAAGSEGGGYGEGRGEEWRKVNYSSYIFIFGNNN